MTHPYMGTHDCESRPSVISSCQWCREHKCRLKENYPIHLEVEILYFPFKERKTESIWAPAPFNSRSLSTMIFLPVPFTDAKNQSSCIRTIPQRIRKNAKPDAKLRINDSLFFFFFPSFFHFSICIFLYPVLSNYFQHIIFMDKSYINVHEATL